MQSVGTPVDLRHVHGFRTVFRAISIVSALLGLIGTPGYASESFAKRAETDARTDPGRQPAVFGDWIAPDQDVVIRVHRCFPEDTSRLCASLLKHAYAALSSQDRLNPDRSLRDRPLIGIDILNGLARAGSNKWKGGQLYDPRTGKTYHAKIKLLDDDMLKISGCIGPRLCKGYVWKKATATDALQATFDFNSAGAGAGHPEKRAM